MIIHISGWSTSLTDLEICTLALCATIIIALNNKHATSARRFLLSRIVAYSEIHCHTHMVNQISPFEYCRAAHVIRCLFATNGPVAH